MLSGKNARVMAALINERLRAAFAEESTSLPQGSVNSQNGNQLSRESKRMDKNNPRNNPLDCDSTFFTVAPDSSVARH
jgi:hypothetical protein